jgi:hypothetical protein
MPDWNGIVPVTPFVGILSAAVVRRGSAKDTDANDKSPAYTAKLWEGRKSMITQSQVEKLIVMFDAIGKHG